jgi:hypothetical protein
MLLESGLEIGNGWGRLSKLSLSTHTRPTVMTCDHKLPPTAPCRGPACTPLRLGHNNKLFSDINTVKRFGFQKVFGLLFRVFRKSPKLKVEVSIRGTPNPHG